PDAAHRAGRPRPAPRVRRSSCPGPAPLRVRCVRPRRRPLSLVLRAGGRAQAPPVVCRDDLSGGRARRARVHDRDMRGLWDRIPPLVRGLALVAIAAVIVVALSLASVLATVGRPLPLAFFPATAFSR